MTEKRNECLKALQALYLELPVQVADDVKNKVLAALHEAEALTDQQVEQIFKDGVYEYPEFHLWEAQRGAVTKLAGEYMKRYKANHPKTHYTIQNLKGDIAVAFQDIVVTIISYFRAHHPDGNPTPLTTRIQEKGIILANLVEKSFAKPAPYPLGSLHMSTISEFKPLFKPFKDGGCEFIYGSPPRDEQCTKPAAYEIKSSLVGNSTGGRYLVCEQHKDELFKYIKGLDEEAAIEPLK